MVYLEAELRKSKYKNIVFFPLQIFFNFSVHFYLHKIEKLVFFIILFDLKYCTLFVFKGIFAAIQAHILFPQMFKSIQGIGGWIAYIYSDKLESKINVNSDLLLVRKGVFCLQISNPDPEPTNIFRINYQLSKTQEREWWFYHCIDSIYRSII